MSDYLDVANSHVAAIANAIPAPFLLWVRTAAIWTSREAKKEPFMPTVIR